MTLLFLHISWIKLFYLVEKFIPKSFVKEM